jgi:hypothetical protein
MCPRKYWGEFTAKGAGLSRAKVVKVRGWFGGRSLDIGPPASGLKAPQGWPPGPLLDVLGSRLPLALLGSAAPWGQPGRPQMGLSLGGLGGG